MGDLLQVRGLSLTFGGVAALDHVDLVVESGRIAGLIGPNGAGKTSLLNCICRFYRPDRGSILFDGKEILAAKPHQLARLGIARTFQHLELFASMNVLDNVMVGVHSRGRPGILSEGLAWPSARASSTSQREMARDALGLVGLSHVIHAKVGALSLGLQKRVSLARALVAKPKLLLLDEPASGMTESDKRGLADLFRDLRSKLDLTILLIEHDMDLVMGLCEHLTVLDFGRRIADGPPSVVRQDPSVISAYLGTPSQSTQPPAAEARRS